MVVTASQDETRHDVRQQRVTFRVSREEHEKREEGWVGKEGKEGAKIAPYNRQTGE